MRGIKRVNEPVTSKLLSFQEQKSKYDNFSAMSEMLRNLDVEPPDDKPPLPPREA